MPALIPTGFTARITWLGRVENRDSTLRASPLQDVMATYAGVEGEDHAGLTRPSCSRVVAQYPKGTDIRNVRQFSVLSSEELDAIAQEMGVDRVEPAWVGASLVLEGIPDFTHVPPASRLQTESGTTLVVDMENRPCHLPAKVIEEDVPGFGKAFKAAAQGRRGVTAWVEREGPLRVGDVMRLHVPDQPVWPHLEAARRA
ncbi:MOSC domain-containing protein [Roseovarius sp. A21]|uniref:MOSC domain-containing protein n=1 Tax=Roseovarius bejariae TaxID=2576383 RepID=A0A844CVQ7_9RHOB|nr:MOSC domain-containing protein [Roseovarius bejariae]MRU16139.1 MOSC domain-containing protein [Roseovarius bejariae]